MTNFSRQDFIKKVNTPKPTRRTFLSLMTTSTLTLASANTLVYAIGSAFKSLDGSMIAGAKCSGPEPTEPGSYCGTWERECIGGYWYCGTSLNWEWSAPECAQNGPIEIHECR